MNNKELKIKELIDEYNRYVEGEILDDIPNDLINNEEFMDYMINGKNLSINYKGHTETLTGHKVYKIKNIKDVEIMLGTKKHDDIISFLEDEIQETFICGYCNQVNDSIEKISSSIYWLNIDDESGDYVISEKKYNFIDKNLSKLNLIQLKWLEFYLYVEEEELEESQKNILMGVVSYLMKVLKNIK